MGEIVTLRDGQDLKDWKCTFVAVVLSICPDINPDAADEASDTEFCEGVDPSLAAALWIEHRWHDVGEDLAPLDRCAGLHTQGYAGAAALVRARENQSKPSSSC